MGCSMWGTALSPWGDAALALQHAERHGPQTFRLIPLQTQLGEQMVEQR